MYRVKQVNGIFIPQKLSFIGWLGIDKVDVTLWYCFSHQIEYCNLYDLESARERIKSYKIQINTRKFKYHKAK